ncbi:MAG: 3-dehydroquinate synthase [Phycisphaerae bacterium]|nr:3-dehydroquinate synthase [Phycisphaerae bacterium]
MSRRKAASRAPARGSKAVRPAATRSAVVRVRTRGAPGAAYDVRIGAGLLARALPGLIGPGGGALLVIDAGLPAGLVGPVVRACEGAKVRWGACVVDARESEKSLGTVERVCAEAAGLRLERGGCIVALGGGVVGDVAGLAGAVYRRGVRVIQCPTSLLAMVDASVGGKTAANLTVKGEDGRARLLKNMVGAFHQPAAVVCDVAALASLPDRELRCGLAECVKHALMGPMLGDASMWKWLASRIDRVVAREPGTLVELIRRNVSAKARVVRADERETARRGAGRAALNLGHTYAHALEGLAGLSWRSADGGVELGPLKHGEAVGLGLLAAVRTSVRLRMLAAGADGPLADLLERVGLPTRVEGLPASEAVAERMRDDKKVAGGVLRLVLPVRGGRVKVVDRPAMAAVRAAIDSLRA